MPRSLPVVALMLFLALWLAASYGVRYELMEDARWVGLCTVPAETGSARCVRGWAWRFISR